MKNIPLLLIISSVISCHQPEYKVCKFESSDSQLKIYNDILNELVEKRFYNGYLGKVSSGLDKEFGDSTNPDTAALRKEIILLQNKIFNDTSKFETICYRPTLTSGPWTHFYSTNQYDAAKEWIELRDLMSTFSVNWKAVADTLAVAQEKYSPQDFQLCTSKIIPYRERKDCGIGIVSFSKLFMNDTGTKGLLYYEFMCGGKCGMGEIILVERIADRWTVRKVNQLWIS